MKDSDPLCAPGREIGGYRVEYKLGAGGMGTVYAAVEPTIGKRVAVKVLRADLLREDNSARRFEREARSVSGLRHPAIVDVFAFGKLEDGRPYFVMPLYEGRTLRELLARTPKMPPQDAWRVAREIAEGLGVAHKAGVLHRDLKPDNVFINELTDRPAQPILLDFGLAKWIDGETPSDDPAAEAERGAKLTNTGVPLGTPIYMAPEQWWASPSSPATDQYAFGIMLFEMLAGRPPFSSQKFPELLDAHLHSLPPTLVSLGIDVPAGTDELLGRLLRKESQDRYPSFADVIAEGDRVFTGASRTVREEPALAQGPTTDERVIVAPRGSGAAQAKSGELGAQATQLLVDLRALSASSPADPATLATLSQHPNPMSLRTVGAFLGVVSVPLAVLLAIGNVGADRYAVIRWFHGAGFGSALALLLSMLGLFMLPRLNKQRANRPLAIPLGQTLAILPAAAAMLSTYMGWAKVTGGIETTPDMAQAFAILHMGRKEIGYSDFIGFGLSAAIALGFAALLASPTAVWKRPAGQATGTVWIVAGALIVSGALPLVALGVGSAAFTLVVGGFAVCLMGALVRSPTPLTLEAGVAALSATLAARAVSQVRADVHAATSWLEPPTRSERVDAMIAASKDRTLTAWLTSAVILVVIGAAAHAVYRTHEAGLLSSHNATRRRVRAIFELGAVLALFGLSLNIDRDFEARRSSYIEKMDEQLRFFAKLSPPGAAHEDLPAPLPSPALQITTDAVALNGKGIGKLSALDAESGRQAMAAALFAALAAPTGEHQRAVDLSLIVDREVPWARVEQLLGIAYEGGARSIDFLLTRGAQPSIPPHAPREVAQLLPGDFAVIDVLLGPEGVTPENTKTFGGVAQELETQRVATEGPLALHVAKRR